MKDPTSDRHVLGDRLERAAVEIMVEASDILRTVWALRRMEEEDEHDPLTHDGSGLPDDVVIPHACDDEPPEAGPVR